MKKTRLGKTDLMVSRTSFGALPIQRISTEAAVQLVRNAFDGGMNYFDTANAYTDSEEKLGIAFKGMRQEVILSTKSAGTDKKTVTAHIEDSLRRLQTDYVDLFQFHNPAVLPDPNDSEGAYAAALEAQQKGYIRHIGITNHRIHIANEAVASGNFATMQFPFSYLSGEREHQLVTDCAKADMGYIAMKGLSGGLLNHAAACYAFMAQHPTVVPIWGIQHQWELDQWLELANHEPEMTAELEAIIAKDREELAGNFCRSCGYCLPCPAGVDIPQAARMSALIRRAPAAPYMAEEWSTKMEQINSCIGCNACKSRCPYQLDIPNLLKIMLEDYRDYRRQYLNTLEGK